MLDSALDAGKRMLEKGCSLVQGVNGVLTDSLYSVLESSSDDSSSSSSDPEPSSELSSSSSSASSSASSASCFPAGTAAAAFGCSILGFLASGAFTSAALALPLGRACSKGAGAVEQSATFSAVEHGFVWNDSLHPLQHDGAQLPVTNGAGQIQHLNELSARRPTLASSRKRPNHPSMMLCLKAFLQGIQKTFKPSLYRRLEWI